MVTIRQLIPDDACKIEEIDRSEHITIGYRFQEGVLEVEEVDWNVPGWTEQGQAEFNLQGQIEDLQNKIESGDRAVGAFDGELLVGFAVLHEKLTEDMAQLSDLFTSREFRHRGIASRLVAEAIRLARERGTKRIYVSAVPSESAVAFYLKQGFIPTHDVHPELFELEPEDIHMILRL